MSTQNLNELRSIFDFLKDDPNQDSSEVITEKTWQRVFNTLVKLAKQKYKEFQDEFYGEILDRLDAFQKELFFTDTKYLAN